MPWPVERLNARSVPKPLPWPYAPKLKSKQTHSISTCEKFRQSILRLVSNLGFSISYSQPGAFPVLRTPACEGDGQNSDFIRNDFKSVSGILRKHATWWPFFVSVSPENPAGWKPPSWVARPEVFEGRGWRGGKNSQLLIVTARSCNRDLADFGHSATENKARRYNYWLALVRVPSRICI
jgi:hypothetical protein